MADLLLLGWIILATQMAEKIMFDPITRRHFLSKTFQGGTLAALANMGFLDGQPGSSVSAKAPALKVQLGPGVEELASLIETTSRHKLLEEIALRVKNNLRYEEILTALFLAGVRDIEPRPVGFKFHAVMVLNSVILTSTACPAEDRWLPLFYAIDEFKISQSRNQKEGRWYMKRAEEARLPDAGEAKRLFIQAMDSWDEEAADRAVTRLARRNEHSELIEIFWRFGARDFRDIGHKAIYTANAWRTMQHIGMKHSEPVMRSLAYALLDYEGDNPAKLDDEADRPWRQNIERVGKIRPDWQKGTISPSATENVLAVLRSDSASDACLSVIDMLNKNIDPGSIWDGLFLGAGELLMRQPGIVGVHCLTSMNALHFGFQASSNDETRRLLLLQAAAFLPLFRELMGLGKIGHAEQIDRFEMTETKSTGPEIIEEIFTEVTKRPTLAARNTIGFLEAGGDPEEIIKKGRELILKKGDNAHDYKFSAAVFEDFYNVSPAWRNRFLAASMFWLRGLEEHDNDIIKRARAAI
jgi:hypothetical protein